MLEKGTRGRVRDQGLGGGITSNKHHYDHISIEFLAFRTQHIAREFTLSDHDTIEWVALKELLNYDLAKRICR